MSNFVTAEDLQSVMTNEVTPETGLQGDVKSPKVSDNVVKATAEDLKEVLNNYSADAPSFGGGSQQVDPTKYDFQLSFDGDNDERRAQEQNFFTTVGKGAGRFLGTTATKALEGIGYTASGLGALAQWDMDVMLDNSFSALMSYVEEEIKEALPIYATEKYNDPRIWRSMWTHKFWADDAVDGAAFMASSIIGSKGIDKIGKGLKVYSTLGKALSRTTRAAKAGNLASKGLKLGGNAANVIDDMNLVTMTAFNSISEAAFEAKDIKDQLRDQLDLKVQAGDITSDEANARASQAAFETFGFNMMALMPSNYLTNSFLFKSQKRLGKLPSLGGSDDAIAELTKGQLGKKGLGAALKSALSEGAYEENIQLAVQNYETDKANGKHLGAWYDAIGENMIKNFTTKEGQKSIMLGALMGLIPGGIGGAREAKEERKLDQQADTLFKMSTANHEQGIKQFFKKKTKENPETGETVELDEFDLDSNDNYQVDKDKVVGSVLAQYEEFNDFISALKASDQGNEMMYEYIQNKRVASLGLPYFHENQGVDAFKDFLTTEKMNEAEMQAANAQPVSEESLSEMEGTYADRAETFGKLYNRIDKQFVSLFDLGKGKDVAEFKRALRVKAYQEGVDQVFWEEKLEQVNERIESLTKDQEKEGVDAFDIQSPAEKKELSKLKDQKIGIEGLIASSRAKVKDYLNESKQRKEAALYVDRIKAYRAKTVDADVTEDAKDKADINRNTQEEGSEIVSGSTRRAPVAKGSRLILDHNNDLLDTDTLDERQATAYGYIEHSEENDDTKRVFVKEDREEGTSHTVITNDKDLIVEDVYSVEKQAIGGDKKFTVGFNFSDNKLLSIKVKDNDNGDVSTIEQVPVKEDGESYTPEELDIIEAHLKKTNGFEVTGSKRDASETPGDGGSIETLTDEEDLTTEASKGMPDFGVKSPSNGVTYVFKQGSLYLNTDEEFHVDIINTKNMPSVSFEYVIDRNNKFWKKMSPEVTDLLTSDEPLSADQINAVLKLENKYSFNNLVDRIPIKQVYRSGNLLIETGLYMHDTAFDFVSVPDRIRKIEDKTARDEAYRLHQITEQFRTRKIRKQILGKLLSGKTFEVPGKTKSIGHYNTTDTISNLGDILKKTEHGDDLSTVDLGVSKGRGSIYMNGSDRVQGMGTPGGVYIRTNATANGKSRVVKVNPNKISSEHADIVYQALTQAYTKGKGGFRGKYEGTGVTGDLSVKEVLDFLVKQGTYTKIDLNDESSKGREHLVTKQLYVDTTDKEIVFGTERIPLYDASQAEIDHFKSYLTANKNYTISYESLDKVYDKKFSIGSIEVPANTPYRVAVFNGDMLNTKLDVVKGTKSLFKQPAVAVDFTSEELDLEVSVDKATKDDIAAISKVNSAQTKTRKKPAKPKPEPKKDSPRRESTPPAPTSKELTYRHIQIADIKAFADYPDGTFIYFLSPTEFGGTGTKHPIGKIVKGYFQFSAAIKDEAVKEAANRIGTFPANDTRKINQMKREFAPIISSLYAGMPTAPITPPSTIEEKESEDNGDFEDKKTNEDNGGLDDILGVYRSTTWAPEGYKVIDMHKELEWLNKRFRLNFTGKKIPTYQVDKLIDLGGNKNAFGQFRRDSFTMYDKAEEGTLYHEAFHRVSLGYLGDKQRDAVYKQARKDFNMPSVSDQEIEEVLAEEFRNFMLNKKDEVKQPKTFKGKIKEFFNNLYDFLYTFFTGNVRMKEGDIQKLFTSIDKGKFKFARISGRRYNELKGLVANFEIKGVQFNKIQSFIESKEVINNLFKLLVESSGLATQDKETGDSIILLSNINDVSKLNMGKLFDVLKTKQKQLENDATLDKYEAQAPLMLDIAELFAEITANRGAMTEAIEDHMRGLGIKPSKNEALGEDTDNITGESRSELSAFSKSSYETDSKDNTATAIKLLVSMLPKSNKRSSLTGLTSLVDFGPMWMRIYRTIDGATSIDNMMDKIRTAADDNFTFERLLKRLELDENLKTQFHATFNKQNIEFWDALTNVEEDTPEITYVPSMINSAASSIKRDWSSDFFLRSEFFNRPVGKRPSPKLDKFQTVVDSYNGLIGRVISDYNNNSTLGDFYEHKTDLISLFNRIHVPLTEKIVDTMLVNKQMDYSEALYDLITKDLAFIMSENSAIYKHLSGQKQDKVTSENVLGKESAMDIIAQAAAESNYIESSSTVLGPEGNLYYTITHNTFMSDELRRLKEVDGHAKMKSGLHYNQNGRWLKTLQENPENVKMIIQSSFSIKGSDQVDRGREYQKLTELEDYLARMSAIRQGFMLPPTPADRKFLYMFAGFDKVDGYLNPDGSFSESVIDLYEGYYNDEVRRIESVRAEVDTVADGVVSSRDLYEFYHYKYVGRSAKEHSDNGYKPSSNDVVVDGKWLYTNTPDGKVYKGTGANHTDFKSVPIGASRSQARAEIARSLELNLNEEIKYAKTIGALQKYGTGIHNNLISESTLQEISSELFGTTDWLQNEESVLKSAIADFMVNLSVGVFESNKTFTGDPASFKHTADELKRLTGYTSTGDNLRTSFPAEFYAGERLIHEDSYNVSYFNSYVYETEYLPEIKEKQIEAYIREGLADTIEEANELAEKRLSAYGGVDQTDGQTLITPAMYRSISIRLGEWPQEKEDAYNALQLHPDERSFDENLMLAHTVMQPLKMTHMAIETNNGNSVPIFDKMSLATLFRPMYEGTQMEELINRMEATGKYSEYTPIDQVKFHTATKTGIKDRREIFTDVKTEEYTDLKDIEVYPQLFENLRRQLITDPHHSDSVMVGSQMQKVGVANVKPNGDYMVEGDDTATKGKDIQKEFSLLRGELSNRGLRKYLSDLGVNEKDLKFNEEGPLLEQLREEALNSNMPDYIANAFRTNEKGGKKVNFDAIPGVRKWIESKFLSANKKATIDLDLPGNSFIQMTDLGVKKASFQGDGTLDVDHGTKLKMANDKGYMEARVSVSLFRSIIPGYDTKTDDQRISYLKKHKELLSIGYRIPTQGANSVYMVEVVGLLPSTVGDVVLLPGEGTVIGGFDFDIDKLFMIRHNYDRNGKIIEYKTDENSSVENRYVDWVNDNANRDMIKYINFLKRDELNSLRDKNKEYLSEIKKWLGSELELNKSTLKDELNTNLDEALSNIKETANIIYLSELYTLNKQVFRQLDPETQVEYYDLSREMDESGIKGAARFQEFMDFTSAKIASGAEQSDILDKMNELYARQLEAFGFSMDYIKERSDAIRETYIAEYKNKKESGELDIKEDYYHMKNMEYAKLNSLNLEAARQVAFISKLPSFNTFKGMPMHEQNTRKALENRLLNVFFAVGLNEHSYILKTTPLGFAGDILKKLSVFVRDEGAGGKSFNEPLARTSPRFQMDVKARFKFGGTGIGPSALSNVHHSLGQQVELSLFEDLGIGNTSEASGNNVTALDGILGKDKEYITEWLSALIDAHVDIAADPYIYYLNVNKVTTDTLLLLVRAGVGGENSFKFVAQPSLFEVAQLDENNGNKLGYEEFNPMGTIKDKYRNLMMSTEEYDTGEYEEIKFTPDLLPMIFEADKLTDGLKSKGVKSAGWYNYQLLVLEAFKYLDVYGKHLSAAVMASRIDTKKFGSNVNEYRNYMKSVTDAYRASVNGEGIRNFDKLLDNSYLTKMTNNSIGVTNDLLKDQILEATPGFGKIIDSIAQNNPNFKGNNIEFLTAISNEAYASISGGFFKEKGLLTKRNIKNLLVGENSIPRRVSKYKASNDPIAKNELISRMSPVYDEGKSIPDFLIMDKAKDKDDKNNLSNEWLKMYTSEDADVVQFAKDLFTYSFLTSGFKNNIYSYFDLAPMELLIDEGYNDYIGSQLELFNREDYNPDILEDIYLNGWNNTYIVPEVKDKDVTDGSLMKSGDNNNTYAFMTEQGYVGMNDSGQHIYTPYVKMIDNGLTSMYKFEGVVQQEDRRLAVYTYVSRRSRFVKGHLIKENGVGQTMFSVNKPDFTDTVNSQIKSGTILDFLSNMSPLYSSVKEPKSLTVVREVSDTKDMNYDELVKYNSYKSLAMDPILEDTVSNGNKNQASLISSSEEGLKTLPKGSLVNLTLVGEAKVRDNYVEILSSENDTERLVDTTFKLNDKIDVHTSVINDLNTASKSNERLSDKDAVAALVKAMGGKETSRGMLKIDGQHYHFPSSNWHTQSSNKSFFLQMEGFEHDFYVGQYKKDGRNISVTTVAGTTDASVLFDGSETGSPTTKSLIDWFAKYRKTAPYLLNNLWDSGLSLDEFINGLKVDYNLTRQIDPSQGRLFPEFELKFLPSSKITSSIKMDKNQYAVNEGFTDWNQLSNDKHYGKEFVEGSSTRFVYDIQYLGNKIAESSEVEQNKKDCNG